ncbi:MAG: hypothetical protein ACRDYZ_00770 [Acidimicrobiales bacterium]
MSGLLERLGGIAVAPILWLASLRGWRIDLTDLTEDDAEEQS